MFYSMTTRQDKSASTRLFHPLVISVSCHRQLPLLFYTRPPPTRQRLPAEQRTRSILGRARRTPPPRAASRADTLAPARPDY